MLINIRNSVLSLLIGPAVCQLQGITSSTCDEQCQSFSNITSAWETEQHASADLDFYKAPSNFSSTLPEGSILQVEYATNLSVYTVPSGLTMSRIIYTTADLNGTIIPTSAYIL